jgi:hypothetical protein
MKTHQTQVSTEQQDIDGNPLIPGRCYCFGIYNEFRPGDKQYGSLAWYGSDGKFYDANYHDTEGEELHEDFDFVVLQSGNVNHDYIFDSITKD